MLQVRQTLLHWAYQLNEADFKQGAKRVKTHGATYVPREQLSGVVAAGGKPAPPAAAAAADAAADASAEQQAKAASVAAGRAQRAQRRGV